MLLWCVCAILERRHARDGFDGEARRMVRDLRRQIDSVEAEIALRALRRPRVTGHGLEG